MLAEKSPETKTLSEEYTVYTFRDPAKKKEGQTDWERTTTTRHKRRAIAKAKKLYASNDYEKVEVKRRFFDTRDGLTLDTTFRVFKKRQWTPQMKKISLLVCGIVLGALIASAVFILMRAA